MFIFALIQCAITDSTINMSDQVAGQQSTYVISLSPMTVPSANAIILVSFPDTYSIPLNLNVHNAYMINNTQSQVFIGSIADWQQITLQNMVNPQQNQTCLINISIYDPNHIETIQLEAIILIQQITKYDFQFDSAMTYTLTNFKLNFTPSLLTYNSIRIVFPYINPAALNQLNILTQQSTCQSSVFSFITNAIDDKTIDCRISNLDVLDNSKLQEVQMSITQVYTPNIQNVDTKISVFTIKDHDFLETMTIQVQIILTPAHPNILSVISSNTAMGSINNLQFRLQPRLSYSIGSSIVISCNQGTFLSNTSIVPGIGIINSNVQKSTYGITISNSVTIAGSDILGFSIINFLNPIGVSSVQFTITVTYNNSVIEYGTTTASLSSVPLPQMTIYVKNSTYGAQTVMSLALNLPFQNPYEASIQITIPKQIQILKCLIANCQFVVDTLIIQSYFMQNQNIFIELMIQLSKTIMCTDNFSIKITLDDILISYSSEGVRICTTMSSMTLLSLLPQVPQSNQLTQYLIQVLIPESPSGTLLSLNLPFQLTSQIPNAHCKGQYGLIEIQTVSNNTVIMNDIPSSGGLVSIICNFTNPRYVQKYSFKMTGSLIFGDQQMAELDTWFMIDITISDVIPNVSLSTSNTLEFQTSTVQIVFQYPRLDSDSIRITIPYSNVSSCEQICKIEQLQNQSTVITVQNSNKVSIQVINPEENTHLAPFFIQIFNKDLLVAQYYDPIGLGNVIANEIQNFSVTLKPAYLRSSTILTLSFNHLVLLKVNQTVSLSIPQELLSLQELSCTNMYCYKQSSNETNYAVLIVEQTIEPGQFISQLSGFQIIVPKAQRYSYDFSLIIKDEYQRIISEVEQTFQFDIACSNQCKTCSIQYNYCDSCNSGLYLYKGQCSSQCPQYYTINNNTCISCQTPLTCLTCNKEITSICEGCLKGYDLINGKCVMQKVKIDSTSGGYLNPHENERYSFEDFPLLMIISGIYLIIAIFLKIYAKKSIKFAKLYCILLSSLELIASVLRVIHFGTEMEIGYLRTNIQTTSLILQYFQQQQLQVLTYFYKFKARTI